MISFLTALLFIAPAFAEDAEPDPEFSFLEEGERNRAKVEADRAPDASLFLDDDNDESEWEMPDSGEPNPTEAFDVLEADEFEDGIDADDEFMEMDPIEDMTGLGPDLSRLTPFGDHFELSVTQSPLGATTAELPLLIARGSRDLTGDVWVVADFYLDGQKVGETRQFYTPSSAVDMGPTYAWLKTTLPVSSPGGVAEVRVHAAFPGKKERLLFVRKAVFTN